MNVSDLINVTFQDNTAYATFNNDDIVGIVLDHHWGPANKLMVLDRAGFSEYFPESLPLGASTVDANKYFAFAQAKKALHTGASKLEVYRVNPDGNWKYGQVNINVVEGSPVATASLSTTQFDSNSSISIGLLYPGYVPQSLLPGFVAIGVKVTVVDSIVTIDVQGIDAEGTKTVVESFEGGYNPGEVVDGATFFIESVVEKSKFIRCKCDGTITSLVASEVEFPRYSSSNESTLATNQISTVLETVYTDIETSQCTLLMSSVADNSLDSTLMQIAGDRMNCMAVIGFPVATAFSKANISIAFGSAGRQKFAVYVAGRDVISVFGMKLQSNCVAGWCGCTCRVAKDVRINQLASARTYGSYPGTLLETLSFNDVLDLHKTGVISVYNSYSGPQIFGVRSMNDRQSSYFGQANVMRVLSAVLKNVFPVALDIIHTDAAANPITRAAYSTTFNSIIRNFIAGQNLLNDSYADCSDELNTDFLTNGGRIFNLVLALHFIGLTEQVNIKVIATDSSVTAEII